jgi:hypothetical protein
VVNDRFGDHHFKIPPPRTNIQWGKNVSDTNATFVRTNPVDPVTSIYGVTLLDGRRLELILPSTKSPFTFQFHDVTSRGGGITFMNLAEGLRQRGVFGFAVWGS